MSAVVTIGAGVQGLGRVVDQEFLNIPETLERARMLDQVYLRRTVEQINWNLGLSPFVPGTEYQIDYSTPSVRGDYWSSQQRAFICQVPGWYNMKVVHEGLITDALADTIKVSKVNFGYSVNGAATLPFAKAVAQRYGDTGFETKTWLYEWSIPGADSVALSKGDVVTFKWSFAAAGNIGFFERFYSRVTIEKIADAASATPS